MEQIGQHMLPALLPPARRKAVKQLINAVSNGSSYHQWALAHGVDPRRSILAMNGDGCAALVGRDGRTKRLHVMQLLTELGREPELAEQHMPLALTFLREWRTVSHTFPAYGWQRQGGDPAMTLVYFIKSDLEFASLRVKMEVCTRLSYRGVRALNPQWDGLVCHAGDLHADDLRELFAEACRRRLGYRQDVTVKEMLPGVAVDSDLSWMDGVAATRFTQMGSMREKILGRQYDCLLPRGYLPRTAAQKTKQ
eukprot:7388864-Prymnesium_polylepis.1